MWNKHKSIVLSNVMIKLSYLVWLAGLAFPPYYATLIYTHPMDHLPRYIAHLALLYLALAVGLIVLIRLDQLLGNVRRGDVFIAANTGHLRAISYCCFAVGTLFIGYGFLWFVGFIVAAAILFLGLILRVLKNVFEQAVALREDNDATI